MIERGDDRDAGSRVRVVLLEASSLRVVWTNVTVDGGGELTLADLLPLADQLGVPDLARVVAQTGESRQVRADVIATSRGAMGTVVSLHRLPDGAVLVLAEDAWRAARRGSEGRPAGRRERR